MRAGVWRELWFQAVDGTALSLLDVIVAGGGTIDMRLE